MVDIHSHVLWGMDDGAPTEEVSLEMLRIAAAAGTTDIVATPHSNSEFEYQPQLIAERIRDLNEKTGQRPRIHRGCDLHLSLSNIMESLKDPGKFSINGNCYLLVEFSDTQISESLDNVLDQLLRADLVPIITHPERNPILQKDTQKIEKWVNLGCLVQVTALSVLGGFGKRAQKAAHQLLSKRLVHVIASDAHDPVHRHPRLDEAFAQVAKNYGQAAANLLFKSNPGKIIKGDQIFTDRSAPPAKRWLFWGAGR